MATGQQGNQRLIDDLLLPKYHDANGGANLLKALSEVLDFLGQALGFGFSFGCCSAAFHGLPLCLAHLSIQRGAIDAGSNLHSSIQDFASEFQRSTRKDRDAPRRRRVGDAHRRRWYVVLSKQPDPSSESGQALCQCITARRRWQLLARDPGWGWSRGSGGCSLPGGRDAAEWRGKTATDPFSHQSG